jgi:hypothetical protein
LIKKENNNQAFDSTNLFLIDFSKDIMTAFVSIIRTMILLLLPPPLLLLHLW